MRERYLLGLGLFLFFLSGSTQFGWAATITANSCSLPDVQEAVSSSIDSDTVVVPAGICLWTNHLTIDKAITLTGEACILDSNGRPVSCPTILKNGITIDSAMIHWSGVANKFSRITSIEFQNEGATTYRPAIYMNAKGYDDRRMRLDHCKFDHMPSFSIQADDVIGVIDHNTFFGTGIFIYTYHKHWGGYTGQGSDKSWADPMNFGSQNFLFIENNRLEHDPNVFYAVHDGYGGARVVFRNNDVIRGWFEMHGTDSSGRARGGRGGEIYNNNFIGSDNGDILANFRSGTWLVHNNRTKNLTYFGGGNPKITVTAYRNIDFGFPFGAADGTNPWDKNVPGGPFLTGTVSAVSEVDQHLVLQINGASWGTDQWSGYSIRKKSGGIPCSDVLVTSGGILKTVTATCPGHGLSEKEFISLRGADQIEYIHGGQRVSSIIDSNTFQFGLPWGADPVSPATGNIEIFSGGDVGYVKKNTSNKLSLSPSIWHKLSFAPGDTFELWKVDQSFDQACVGQGTDLQDVDFPNPIPPFDQVIEGCYEWNNIDAGGLPVDFSSQYPAQIKPNIHFFNNTPKPSSEYTPFVYPHPLVSGIPYTPPSGGSGKNEGNVAFTKFKNIFNPTKGEILQIGFQVSLDTLVSLDIRNSYGQLINDYSVEGRMEKVNEIIWDGRNREGRIVSSGIYSIILKTSNSKKSKKFVVIK